MNIKRLVNRMTRTISPPSVAGRRNSDASSAGSMGQQSSGSSAHSEDPEPRRSVDKMQQHAKAPIDADNPHLTARIKAMQSKQTAAMARLPHLKILQKLSKGPEHLSDTLLFELGIMPDKRVSKLVIDCLKILEFMDYDNNLSMPPSLAPSIMPALQSMMAQAGQPLSATQNKDLLTLMNSMAENFKNLGQDISRLPRGQRPHWAFYAELAVSPQDSADLMHKLREGGVVDHDMLPRNGGLHFEAFAQMMKNHWQQRDPEAGEIAASQLAALHEALFPLPLYEAKPKGLIALPKYEDTLGERGPPPKYKP